MTSSEVPVELGGFATDPAGNDTYADGTAALVNDPRASPGPAFAFRF